MDACFFVLRPIRYDKVDVWLV